MTQPPTVALHRLSTLSAADRDVLLSRAEDELGPFIEQVKPLIEEVRVEGDEALARFAKRFDAADINSGQIAATKADFDLAFDTLDPEFIEVLEYSADNIRRFHEKQVPQDMWMTEIRPGAMVGERYTPIESVACYSPRGKGSFPSVTLMTAIPAVVAGVTRPIILTPAGADGHVDPATLVAARLAGIEEVYKVGGGQAVAAAAFGTQTIPKCRKIVGPGSPYFMAAKQVLQNKIDTGMPAGPSEVIVMADGSVDPALAALDIIIESEHGADSSAFLVTWSDELAHKACKIIPTYWEQMSDERVDYSSSVLSSNSGGIVLCDTPEEAYAFINDYAPEHLQILSKTPYEYLHHIRNASEILLGEHAAGSIANYMMGPNCVLPTSGGAHTHSPLGVHDFMKSASIGHLTRTAFNEMAPKTHKFATYEGFDAHALAVSDIRRKILGNL